MISEFVYCDDSVIDGKMRECFVNPGLSVPLNDDDAPYYVISEKVQLL